MIIVVFSYRQTVRAYPSGGGAYIVSKDNLGVFPGLLAAAALLTDYVLTVSVSVVAGVFAITSAVPSLNDHKVALSIGFDQFAEPEYWAAVVKPGMILFEIGGLPEPAAKDCMRRVAHKMPFKCRFVKRHAA